MASFGLMEYFNATKSMLILVWFMSYPLAFTINKKQVIGLIPNIAQRDGDLQ